MRERAQTSTALLLSALLNLAAVYAVGSAILQAPRVLQRIEIELKRPPRRAPLRPRLPPPPSAVPPPAKAVPLPAAPAVPKRAALSKDTPRRAPLPTPPPRPLRVPAAPPSPAAVPLRMARPGPPPPAPAEPVQASVAAPPPPAPPAPSVDADDAQRLLDGYLEQVRARIEAAKRYPRWARRARLEGRATVSFGLRPDGTLTDTAVTAGSGSEALDRAALRAVERGAPYPPFPGDAADLPESFSVTVVFVLE